eukprot:1161913-Pelagomonas_calceolata.AAC.17
MSGHERSTQPRLASLSPGKALCLGSLPHDTTFIRVVAGEMPASKCKAEQHMHSSSSSSGSGRRGREPLYWQQWGGAAGKESLSPQAFPHTYCRQHALCNMQIHVSQAFLHEHCTSRPVCLFDPHHEHCTSRPFIANPDHS